MSKSEETRELIIKKAAPIFNKYGYEGTSMSQLTQAIGMTKGAIYGNFKDKDEIALAAFDYNFFSISKKIAAVVRSRNTAPDKLIALASFYLDTVFHNPFEGGCPIMNAAVDADNAHDLLKKRVAGAVEAWMETIAKITYRGMKENQISRNVRPEQFATLFISLIEGGILLSRATGSTIHLSRNVDHIIHLVNTELRL